jgi:hypothetical protein
LLFFWFHFFSSSHCYGEWIKGRWIPHLLLSFGSPVLEPLYACTVFDHNISSVLVVTIAPLRTREMSSAFSAPRLWYPIRSLSTRDLLCVTPIRCLAFCHGMCIGRSRPALFSLLFSPCSALSWFSSSIMAYGLRENKTSPACNPFCSRQSPWRTDRRPRVVVFAWNELGLMQFLFKLHRSTWSI